MSNFFIKKSNLLKIIDKKDNHLVMNFEKIQSEWHIFIFDEKLTKYIFTKFPAEYNPSRKYEEVEILDFIYIIKTKFRKFIIDFGE